MGLINDSAEHKAIRESVAGIAKRYGPEYFLERGRTGAGIEELWNDLGAAGLLGLHLPEDYGGGGGGMAEAVVVVEELAAQGMPLLIWVISPAICGSILACHASEDMKRRWLPPIADGSTKMAFGLTEPDAGSNSHNVKTTARRTDTGWVISGSKYYISAVDQSEAILLVARDADHSTAQRNRLSLFVVPTDSPGLTYAPIDTSIVSPDKQFTVYLDEVEVGEEALIGLAGNGLRQVFDGLNPERILVGALSSGIGRYAIGKAVDYAQQRSVWSAPIGAHQGIAHPLAECHIAVELGRMATQRSAELFDAGEPAGEAANIAKFAASEAALKALDQSIQTHGGNGLSHEYGLSELWFVTRLMRTAPVSREMVLNYVAQTSLGLPRSY
ncbi:MULTISPECIES: acyl-CoA dehydrogenase family protein [Mycobacterium]|uniref:Acyl-CoA dehydrogenase FadE n=1 Tax=Mycobacterium kiyosense TaxID=2871094 RepID=A0A9P3UWB8_9MYCO|nr:MULTISPECIES: acyl-CoA dehydrogenase family protein [Mycobacterium]BDB43922.1 putative acyl-CoA dehydrogenase FadE [Mycobacterium kiyosense]BDE15476.1 putative acyl-CoA dehydrogenase FadE [Mycobacterium sp. 20KCMC460]GLB81099.1 putative acyl-CoA dehydrogenase FadE [Mycobacterium kiyosense]GLB90408.1 putative acyl-CoA dehydrogenase FadE [Mycobacterium kiyosense]GLB93580.1 putative acyl-CoA dehydrogenase FadE [Mycobacterium kiyosense]